MEVVRQREHQDKRPFGMVSNLDSL